MKSKDELIKHGTIMIMATVFSGIFNLGYHFTMVRMLGPEAYSILFSLTALFMIIAFSAGPIQTVIAKYISSFRVLGQQGKMSYLILRALKKLSVYFGILLTLYLLCSKLIAGYLKIPMVMPVAIIGFVLFIGLIYPVNFGALQGTERFTRLGSVYILGAFLRLIFGILFVFLGLGVNGPLLGAFISSLSVLVISLWFLRDIWGFRPRDKEIGKSDIYKYFIPVFIAYTSFAIIAYIDVILVKHYFPPLAAGYYSAVSVIGKAFIFLPASLACALFPKVSSQHELGRDTRPLLKKALLFGSAVCLTGIVICIFLPKAIIHIQMNRADITQDALSTMIPLFRLIGFAITPYGLACIVINYYLARCRYDFLPLLILGALSQILLLTLFHKTLIHVLTVLFIVGIFIFISCFIPSKFLIDKILKRR